MNKLSGPIRKEQEINLKKRPREIGNGQEVAN